MKGEYYKTKESVEEYIELAKDVNGRQLIEKLVKILPPGSVLLEIGSGPGTDWKILNNIYEVISSEIYKGLFVNYHNVSGLEEKFKHYFELLLIEDYKELEDNDSLLLIGKKKSQNA